MLLKQIFLVTFVVLSALCFGQAPYRPWRISQVSLEAGVLLSDFNRNDLGFLSVSSREYSASTLGLSAGGAIKLTPFHNRRWRVVSGVRYNHRQPPQVLIFPGGESGPIGNIITFSGVPVRPHDPDFREGDVEFPNLSELSIQIGPEFSLVDQKRFLMTISVSPTATAVLSGDVRLESRDIQNININEFVEAATNGSSLLMTPYRKFRFEIANTISFILRSESRISPYLTLQYDWQISPLYQEDLTGFDTWTGIRPPSQGEPRWFSLMARVGVSLDLSDDL